MRITPVDTFLYSVRVPRSLLEHHPPIQTNHSYRTVEPQRLISEIACSLTCKNGNLTTQCDNKTNSSFGETLRTQLTGIVNADLYCVCDVRVLRFDWIRQDNRMLRPGRRERMEAPPIPR